MARVLLGPSDIPEGGIRAFDAGVERLVLVSRLGGTFHAISDWCNHAGCLLSQGEFTEETVICPCHGASFDRKTGKNVNSPELCGDQDVFHVIEEKGQLVVEFED
jgi:3-phenylpropionate/trans-cinnamate dioxygenase ferredoxin component